MTTMRNRAAAVRRFVGGFFLVMAGINAGIVVGDPHTYRTFADGSWSSFVTEAWHDVVMAHPLAWILLLAAGEVTLGVLLLQGGPAARAGWAGVVAFHVLLMSFGFGFWLWSVPVLAVLVPCARADWSSLAADHHRRPEPAPVPLPVTSDPGRTRTMTTLVVHESMFGNSRTVAHAITQDLPGPVEVVDVVDAPTPLPRTSTSWSSAGPPTPSR